MNIDFPVVEFDRDGRMLPIPHEKRLATSGYDFWKRGEHKGLIIIDSRGVERIVKEAQKVGYPGFFFGYSLLRHRGVKVKLVFEAESRVVELEDLKRRVITSLKSQRRFWAAADIGVLLHQIENASTHREVIESLLGNRP